MSFILKARHINVLLELFYRDAMTARQLAKIATHIENKVNDGVIFCDDEIILTALSDATFAGKKPADGGLTKEEVMRLIPILTHLEEIDNV